MGRYGVLIFTATWISIGLNGDAYADTGGEHVQSIRHAAKDAGQLAETAAFKGAAIAVATEIVVPAQAPEPAGAGNGPRKTGVVYALPEPARLDAMPWQSLGDGGYAIKLKVHADRAKRLRLHLRIEGERSELQIRLMGNMPGSVVKLVPAGVFAGGDIWLPLTDGDDVVLELYAPSQAARDAMGAVMLDRVNYLYAAVDGGQFAGLGRAQMTQHDVACWPNSSAYNELLKAASATPVIHYLSSNGGSYVCSGTLLNDMNNSGTPWFITANHCLGDQYAAGSASFEWYFQATACGSTNLDSRYKETFGGAQLLWTDLTYDVSLLKLNTKPPYGVMYAGWDSNPLVIGQKVWGIHHPKSDYTMANLGNVAALKQASKASNGVTRILNQVSYSYGGAEEGSSGSGVFVADSTGHAFFGTLSSRSTGNYQTTYYSPFDAYYPYIKPYLNPDGNDNDCFFSWAESKYAQYFPGPANTTGYQTYNYRYYPSVGSYLAINQADDNVYVLIPNVLGSLTSIGAKSGWIGQAKAAGCK